MGVVVERGAISKCPIKIMKLNSVFRHLLRYKNEKALFGDKLLELERARKDDLWKDARFQQLSVV